MPVIPVVCAQRSEEARVRAVFEETDVDQSGLLDEEEISALLPVLATHTDGPAAAEALAGPLATHLSGVADRGDVAAALQALLASCDPEARWVALLKCMHQEMLAPAVLEMRLALGPSGLQFKDLRGAWRLAVRFGVETVSVAHLKGEMAAMNFHYVVDEFPLSTHQACARA